MREGKRGGEVYERAVAFYSLFGCEVREWNEGMSGNFLPPPEPWRK